MSHEVRFYSRSCDNQLMNDFQQQNLFQMKELLEIKYLSSSKKNHYKAIARIRKDKWAAQYHLKNQYPFKSHFFVINREISEERKQQGEVKGEHHSHQRIKNRMAAQQSRERRRIYVQDLQNKVRKYQQIIEKQGYLCRNCHSQLFHDHISEQNDLRFEERQASSTKIKEENFINEYLEEEMIRVDNQGVTSPFGMFFLLCIIGVIALFAIRGSTNVETNRVLSQIQSVKEEAIPLQTKEIKPRLKNNQQNYANFAEFIKNGGNLNDKQCRQDQIDRTMTKFNLQKHTSPKLVGWTKIGEYICSEPEIVLGQNEGSKYPQFLLLRTQRKDMLSPKQVDFQEQKSDYQILSKQWQRIEISSCFLGPN